MLDFKACPRCKGDVQKNRDYYGEFRQCLQCGHTEYPRSEVDPYAELAASVKRKAAA